MSYRLQVLIPEELDVRLRKAAQRSRTSKGEWVRRAIEETLRRTSESSAKGDPLSRLASLGGATGDIGQLLAEIGR
jgi:predicted DNA-binding protein